MKTNTSQHHFSTSGVSRRLHKLALFLRQKPYHRAIPDTYHAVPGRFVADDFAGPPLATLRPRLVHDSGILMPELC